MTLHKLHIVDSLNLTVRAFLRLQKSEMRAINTHSHHVGQASVATPDADILRSVPILYCRASESNDSGFFTSAKK